MITESLCIGLLCNIVLHLLMFGIPLFLYFVCCLLISEYRHFHSDVLYIMVYCTSNINILYPMTVAGMNGCNFFFFFKNM